MIIFYLNSNKIMLKLNVLLALREKLANRYAQMNGDYTSFFKNKQGAFQGTLKTHEPLDGYAVDSTKVANVRIITTVNEKMDWWLKEALEYFNTALAIEASNGEGAPTVPLEFEGKTYGPYPATVLLRLRGFIENDKFATMLGNIPVREETRVWNPTTDEDYKRRGNIFETERQEGETRTTETHDEILKDINLDPQHLPSNYHACVTQVKKTVKTGDYTSQLFTGEWTHQQRANLLKRRSMLLDAINIALQKVNDREAVECNVNELFKHLIYG
jgi:hypothetical protein